MSKDKDTKIVINIIRNQLNFEAKRIPENEEEGETADIFACKNSENYLFEVKSRDDHTDFMEQVEKSQDYQMIEYKKPIRRSNKISSILEKANGQLEATPKTNNDYCCVWFRAINKFIPDEADLIRTSLYGIRHLLVANSNKEISRAECYYFDYNDFFRFKNISAVVIENGRGIHLCVNDYSMRIQSFRNSVLYQYFSRHESLTDPEKMCDILIARINCPRNKTDKVINHLQKKYKLRITGFVEMNSMGGAVKYTCE